MRRKEENLKKLTKKKTVPVSQSEALEYTLLENGLDFISSALKHLKNQPTKRELKYAVLHLSAGIELILKERLKREHWSLVFDKPADAPKNELLLAVLAKPALTP